MPSTSQPRSTMNPSQSVFVARDRANRIRVEVLGNCGGLHIPGMAHAPCMSMPSGYPLEAPRSASCAPHQYRIINIMSNRRGANPGGLPTGDSGGRVQRLAFV